MSYNLEVIFINNNNNNYNIVKAKIDSVLFIALKQILKKKKMTQQDLIVSLVKEFVLENLSLYSNNSNN